MKRMRWKQFLCDLFYNCRRCKKVIYSLIVWILISVAQWSHIYPTIIETKEITREKNMEAKL